MNEEEKTPTVLMIDDEVNARKMVSMLLEREGFTVLTAPNGEEGLVKAKVAAPDIIIMDIMMPTLDGHEALKKLRKDQDTRAIPVIIVSAKGTEKDIAASFELGATFHVEKPYDTQDLLRKLQAALLMR